MTWVQVIIWTILIVILVNNNHRRHHPHHHLQIQCPTQECTWRLFCRSEWPPVPSTLHYFLGWYIIIEACEWQKSSKLQINQLVHTTVVGARSTPIGGPVDQIIDQAAWNIIQPVSKCCQCEGGEWARRGRKYRGRFVPAILVQTIQWILRPPFQIGFSPFFSSNCEYTLFGVWNQT